MSYSLNAFCPTEGYNISFNGSSGRIEHICEEKVYISADGSVPGALVPEGTRIRIFPDWKPAYEVEIWTGEGGHGGGDPPMLTDLFAPDPPEDRYKRAADHRAGTWSVLTGAAANVSMAENRPVAISELIDGLDQPDYPDMPSADGPIPLPEREGVIASRG